jgi:hypothetical protein
MPAGYEKWPITVTLLAASGKGECPERKFVRNDRASQLDKKKSLDLRSIERLCQTARPRNYENRREMLCTNTMRRRFSEAKMRFLN